jgi:hypothetical protein
MKLRISEEEAQEFASGAGLAAALLLVPCLLAIIALGFMINADNKVCKSYGPNYYKTQVGELGFFCTDGTEGNFPPVPKE